MLLYVLTHSASDYIQTPIWPAQKFARITSCIFMIRKKEKEKRK